VIENFKPGVLADMDLSYDDIRAINPRIVMTSITNFGQDGPYRDWEGTDLTLYAMGGAMLASGDPDLEPVKTAGQMASFHAGYSAALSTAIALWKAERTGEGDHLDVSFFDTAMQSTDMRLLRILGYQYNDHQVTGRLSMAATIGLGTGVYACADGFFELTAGVSMFERIARMIGADHLFEDPDWNTSAALAVPERSDEFDALLVPWCLERDKKQIQAACMEHGVLGAPVNTVGQLFDDQSFKERGFFQTIDHPVVGPLTYPGYNFVMHNDAGEPMPGRAPAPLLGQHTTDTLNAIGIHGDEVARLRAQGVV
jgi:crotonobetainyl-CoA:carnitine CoA-transferase CaiB-like acyl-CoA transferase